MIERVVSLVDTECNTCSLPLGLSAEHVGHITLGGEVLAYHLDCAPNWLLLVHYSHEATV